MSCEADSRGAALTGLKTWYPPIVRMLPEMPSITRVLRRRAENDYVDSVDSVVDVDRGGIWA